MAAKLQLVGKRFGKLLVVAEHGQDERRSYLWKCQCDCGNACVYRGSLIKTGRAQSCGCGAPRRLSSVEHEEACRLYLMGLTTTEVGRQLGVSQAHISKILQQRGVPVRPPASRFDPDGSKICEGCGSVFKRRRTRSGREEKPFRFAERKFCSEECRQASVASKNKERFDSKAWIIGKRTLIAKTCPSCGELLSGMRFQQQQRGYYGTTCTRCVTAGWIGAKTDDERRVIRRKSAKQSKRQNDEMRDTAWRWGTQWTGPDLEVAARDDLTAVQVAAMLGRTPAAVRAQRGLLQRRDPKTTFLAGLARIPKARS